MKLPLNVRSKPSLPRFLKRIPFLFTIFHGTAQGMHPFIFIPREVYDNLKTNNPNPYHISLLQHEQTHLDRQIQQGKLKWIIKYAINPKFRLSEEMIANKNQMKFMKKNKLKFPFEKKAQMLSSWIYFWPINYSEALKELKSAWDEV